MAEVQAKGLAFKPAGVAAPTASVDAMVLEAKRRWQARGRQSAAPRRAVSRTRRFRVGRGSALGVSQRRCGKARRFRHGWWLQQAGKPGKARFFAWGCPVFGIGSRSVASPTRDTTHNALQAGHRTCPFNCPQPAHAPARAPTAHPARSRAPLHRRLRSAHGWPPATPVRAGVRRRRGDCAANVQTLRRAR
jgi:hypothetical protein